MAAQPLRAEEKGDRGLELRREEEHLEVEEGLLVHREVGLAWGAGDTATQRGFLLAAWPQAEAPDSGLHCGPGPGSTTSTPRKATGTQRSRCKTQTACPRWARNRVRDLKTIQKGLFISFVLSRSIKRGMTISKAHQFT